MCTGAIEMYEKAQNDYWKWLAENKYPSYGHASIMDTSEMLYLSTRDGGDKGWTKKELIPTAVGDPVRQRGEPRDPELQADPQWDYGRCAAVDAGAGEEDFRYEGRLRGAADEGVLGDG